MKQIKNNICAPRGFLGSSVHVGIRKNPNKQDLAIIYSEVPAIAAAVYTTNRVQAAPILVTKQHLKKGKCQALVVNSGNANACTGKLGIKHAKAMATEVAKKLNIPANQVAVSSTGVIGVPLPIEKILKGIDNAAKHLKNDRGDDVAQAIMTTDTFQKSIAIEFMINNKKVRIGGISKGAGMIHPNMATMLGFITTDVNIAPNALKQALKQANDNSFNLITVDGDTSTNDMLLIMANGLADNPKITSTKDKNWKIFYEALSVVCKHLAKEIARDGEGATKLIEVHVKNAKNFKQACLAARAVCGSPLVKTAIHGEDANWGRIAAAVGYSGAEFDPDKLSVQLQKLHLLKNGTPQKFNEVVAKKQLREKNIMIIVDLSNGKHSVTAWGCDLTHAYIDINASYRS